QVVGGDIGFLAVDPPDLPARFPHAVAHVEQQRARPAGEIEYAAQRPAWTGGRVLAVQRDDGREDAGDALWRVELARLLAAAGGELPDQVLIGIAQRVGVGGEPRQAFGDPS